MAIGGYQWLWIWACCISLSRFVDSSGGPVAGGIYGVCSTDPFTLHNCTECFIEQLSGIPHPGAYLLWGCPENYVIRGGLNAIVWRCELNDSWIGDEPRCRPVTCPVPPTPAHGFAVIGGQTCGCGGGPDLPDESPPGFNVTYKCDDGYELVGDNVNTCLENGTWSLQDQVPTCQVECDGSWFRYSDQVCYDEVPSSGDYSDYTEGCFGLNSSLPASLYDNETIEFLQTLVLSSSLLWVGAQEGDDWAWEPGRPGPGPLSGYYEFSYIERPFWAKKQPSKHSHGCIAMTFDKKNRNNFLWNDMDCEKRYNGFICQFGEWPSRESTGRRVRREAPGPGIGIGPGPGCGFPGNPYTEIYRDVCYQLNGHFKVPWHQAVDLCQIQGGRLAVIPDESTQDDLKRILKRWTRDYGPIDWWIGGFDDHDHEDRASWYWEDGLRVAILNWRSGQPETEDESCLAVDATDNFLMSDEDCGDSVPNGGLCQLGFPACGDPGDPANGHRSPHDRPTYLIGARMEFFCFDGYRLVGSRVLFCDTSGQWSDPKPECEAIGNYCDEDYIPKVKNAYVHNVTSTAIRGLALYACSPGYLPDDRPVVRCKAYDYGYHDYGEWGNPKFECIDIDECNDTDVIYPCDKINGNCTNKPGSYKCTCEDGYKLQDDGSCADINECGFTEEDYPCDPVNGGCNNFPGGYNCSCEQGYEFVTNGSICKDINECDNSPPTYPCDDVNGDCINTGGSYFCTCDSGWELDGNRQYCLDVNECGFTGDNYPCDAVNGGCNNYNGTYNCSCREGWELTSNGSACVDINECEDPGFPCDAVNGGCINTGGSYFCTCNDGWQFLSRNMRLCRDVNECAFTGDDYPCDSINGGCNNYRGTYNCSCQEGWQLTSNGSACEDIDECEYPSPNYPCDSVNGGCINLGGFFFCTCNDGWELDGNNQFCLDVNECGFTGDDYPCDSVNGGCNNYNGTYNCSCQEGWELTSNGSACIDIDECGFAAPNYPCDAVNGGCTNTGGSYFCSCNSGWQLDGNRQLCLDVNECGFTGDDYPCDSVNGGCNNYNGAYNCSCQQGWQLTSNGSACEDINECGFAAASYPCDAVNGGCTNTGGSYFCSCNSGWQLDGNNQFCLDVNECGFTGDDYPCDSVNGGCNNYAGTYNCSCEQGWQLTSNGSACEDINECGFAAASYPCDAVNGGCTNTGGSYFCSCNSGWQLDGNNQFCLDVDECGFTAEAYPCDSINGGCNNFAGTYNCSCGTGWELTSSGSACTDIDECTRGSHTCDAVNGNCVNNAGSYGCTCNNGWFLHTDRRTCLDVDECAQTGSDYPCDSVNGGCTDTDGSYTCTCNIGWSLVAIGQTCEDIDECARSGSSYPCDATNGNCTNNGGSYVCTCNVGWSLGTDGSTCEDVDECARTGANYPCDPAHGGCTNTNGSYVCTCNIGWMLSSNQHSCQDIIECATDSCFNGGTCVEGNNGFTCMCLEGFTGDRCTIQTSAQIALCANDPQDIGACLPGKVLSADNVCTDPCNNNCDYETELCASDGTNQFSCVCRPGRQRHQDPSIGTCEPVTSIALVLIIIEVNNNTVDFTSDYLNSSSQAYQEAAAQINEAVRLAYAERGISGLVAITITGFFSGSLGVNLVSHFDANGNVSTNMVQSAVTSEVDQNSGFLFDSQSTSLRIEPGSIMATAMETNECLNASLNDCADNATCIDLDTVGGFTCMCELGFRDIFPDTLPGRVCDLDTSAPEAIPWITVASVLGGFAFAMIVLLIFIACYFNARRRQAQLLAFKDTSAERDGQFVNTAYQPDVYFVRGPEFNNDIHSAASTHQRGGSRSLVRKGPAFRS